MPTAEKNPNHLINEKSPYLLQHVYNPVNWYPWGDEAFLKAKEENKPVFLSIGYSTCHWCHVMAHESFEDAEVAKLLNDGYISIKVDKEERPDVDAVYMAVCQAFTQQGGWPLTIIMTPDKKPFFAGTYYPKKTRYQVPGIIEILNAVTNYWQKDPEALITTADEVIAHLKSNADRSDGNVSKEMIEYAIKLFKQNFDHENGGFSSKPKFPTPHNLLFLLRYADLEQDKNALAMIEKTLEQMYRGGIFDHIGFGFSRYSTDEKWLIPHFEKMLYDNALLIMVYLEAYQITKKEIYKVIAEQIIQYILREMTDENGGFYCAQDADSDGEEGKYYVFTADEIIRILGEKDAEYFNAYFGITPEGNFEGKNILNLLENIRFGDKNEKIEPMKQKIFEYRQNRTYLHKDDKILTSWNALMITALAKAYRIIGKKEYLHAAIRAFDFLEQNLADESYHLYVRYRDGETSGAGHVDDYAFLIWSLLELYETEYDANFLQKALEFNKIFINEFYDDKDGGFYLYGSNSENLIIRPKEIYDGAIPSGNSVAAYNLQKLAKITAQKSDEELADQQLKFIAANIADYPAGFAFSLIAMMYALYPSREIICVIKDDIDLQNFKISVNKLFMPNTVVLVKDEKNNQLIIKIAPFTMDYPFSKSSSVYYLCANNACSAPVEELESLIKML